MSDGTTEDGGRDRLSRREARALAKKALHRAAMEVERRWDARQLERLADVVPEDFRIVAYLGHASDHGAVVRCRVVDDEEPAAAVEGEDTWAAVRRTIARFSTDELPGVPLVIRVGGHEVATVTDEEGYADVRIDAAPDGLEADADGWAEATIALAGSYRGLEEAPPVAAQLRVPGASARFAVISDVDDTVLHTGAQRMSEMVKRTLVGSALTRTPFAGAAELYRALEVGATGDDANPFFYVSSSPWNLHGFLTRFLEHRDFPLGPLLLRDLGIDEHRFIKGSHGDHKHRRIAEVLDLHPDLDAILIGDSGQHDPEIYAEVVRRYPGRIRAVYIREVRLDPGDGRVERVVDAWDTDVPFVLAADSTAVAEHAVDLGLLSPDQAHAVATAVATTD